MGRFNDLIEKHTSGTITSFELDELNELLLNRKDKEHFKKVLGLEYRLALEQNQINAQEKIEALNTIKNSLKPVRYLRFKDFYRIAAILVVIVGCGVYFFLQQQNTVSPEKQFVTLELDEGEVKTVNKEKFQVKTKEQEVLVERKGDTLKYSALNNKKPFVYNSVNVPNGSTLILQLADGSVVHLNSGSKLRYPTGFNDKGPREVTLTGEGYFEVAHDTLRPFIVHSAALDVEVLGTIFNMNAYPNNTNITTVLVEGRVAVKPDGVDQTILKPGMLAAFSKTTETLQTATVNTDSYTAWVRGILAFEEANLEDIANDLERKFNVKIKFENQQLKTQKFTAKFKNKPIEHILKVFQKSYDFQYSIEGNNVIIR